MAAREEIIRYVYQVTGDDALTGAARALLELGDVSEETEASVRKLADEFAATRSAEAAAAQYKALAESQQELGAAAEAAGLKLKLASEQHAASTAALDAADATLAEARKAQADYAAQTDRTTDRQAELSAAVKAAASAQRDALDGWKASNKTLKEAERNYGTAAKNQQHLQAQLGKLDDELSKAGVSSRDLAGAQATLANRTAEAQAGMQRLQSTLAAERSVSDAAAAAAQRIADAHKQLGTQPFKDIDREIEKVRRAYETLRESGQLTGKALVQANVRMTERVRELKEQTNGWAASLDKVRNGAVVSVAAFAGVTRVLGDMARQAGEFERTMASVQTLTGDADGIPKLSRQVRDLAREFGGDATKNAQALYDILSAGVDNAADAMAVLRTANELALGGMTDIGTAAKGVTATLNAYGLSMDRAGDVSDAFFVGAKAGATDVDALASSIGRVAPIAATAGVGFDQLIAGIATLTNQGLSTDEAVTQLRSTLSSIVAPSVDAKKAAAELGVEFNVAALKSKGLAGFLADITDAADGNSEVLSRLFGNVNALQGVLSLGGISADKYADALKQMEDRAGATADAVEIMSDTSAQRLAKFHSELQALQQSFGDMLTALTPVLSGVSRAVGAFNNLPEPARKAAGAILANAAAMTALGNITSRISGPLRLLVSDITNAARGVDVFVGSTAEATSKVAGLRRGLNAMPKAVKIAFAFEGLIYTYQQLMELIEALTKYREMQVQAEAIEQDRIKTQDALADKAARLAQGLKEYSGLLVKSAADVRKLSQDEAQRYKESLVNAARYYQAVAINARNAGDAAGAAFAKNKVEEYRHAIESLAPAFAAVVEDAKAAAEAGSMIGLISGKLEKIGESSKQAKKDIGEFFSELDIASESEKKLGGIALVMQNIANESDKSANAVSAGLSKALNKLSTEDLLKFGNAARAEFARVGRGAEESSAVMDAVTAAVFKKMGLGAQSAGKDAVTAFEYVANTAGVAGKEIGDAFDDALKKLTKKEDVESLGDALRKAFEAGRISAEQYQDELEALKKRLHEIQHPDDPPDGPNPQLQQLGQQLRDVGADAETQRQQILEYFRSLPGAAEQAGAELAGALASWHAEFSKTSAAAADLFDTLAEGLARGRGAFSGGSDGFVKAAEAMADAVAIVTRKVDDQRTSVARLTDDLAGVGTSAEAGFGTFGANVDQAALNLDRMIAQVKSGKTQFDLLGEADLAPLLQSLEAARQRTQALQDQAAQAKAQLDALNDSLQDQIDQARGDDTSVENRRFQKQLDDARKLAEQQGNLNSKEYQDAVRRIEELHKLNLQKIRQQADAQRTADDETQARRTRSADQGSGNGGQSSGGGLSTGPITFQLHSTVTDPRTMDDFARKIKKILDDIARRSR